jgi:hypothetical protein
MNQVPQYKCNAPLPGTHVNGHLVEFGALFETIEHPRQMWIPMNQAARDAFAKWNEEVMPAQVEAEIKKKRIVGKDAKEYREKHTALRQRIPNEPIAVEERLPDAEIEAAKRTLERLEKQKADILARQQGLSPSSADGEGKAPPAGGRASDSE